MTSIDKFRNTTNGNAESYAVYLGNSNERYFDDNIGVKIDMTDMYEMTSDTKYLDRAELVWDFILTGMNDKMGGGVHWKEFGNSKNMCSTAPAALSRKALFSNE
ncbi:glycoside hydrolase family 76 protein [Sphingobacterium corticis]|uniref:Glycoside hydrolase family 76 protein n=1 Tax=Sphingobacterium corticis TaxID=1812823 RepID=A0ABW5NJJ7_9SPHI